MRGSDEAAQGVRHTSEWPLLPPSPRGWLPDDHLANLIDNVVDQLDLSELFAGYDGTKGQPPYPPQMMIGVWLCSYCVGIRSSRRLERALYEDDGLRVKLAQQAGLVRLGQVAIGGTKPHASASKHRAMSYGRMVREEERLRDEIACYFEEAETTDQPEDELHGAKRGDELPDHLKTEAQRLEAIREAMAQLEEEARQEAEAEQEKRREEATRPDRGGR